VAPKSSVHNTRVLAAALVLMILITGLTKIADIKRDVAATVLLLVTTAAVFLLFRKV
jgi:hypothetical protein